VIEHRETRIQQWGAARTTVVFEQDVMLREKDSFTLPNGVVIRLLDDSRRGGVRVEVGCEKATIKRGCTRWWPYPGGWVGVTCIEHDLKGDRALLRLTIRQGP
jgi:hypothetical protein